MTKVWMMRNLLVLMTQWSSWCGNIIFFRNKQNYCLTLPNWKIFGNNNGIEQNNTIEIQLEKNGKRSSIKLTFHINIRYFYFTDNIQNNQVSVMYKPTHYMVFNFWQIHCKGNFLQSIVIIYLDWRREIILPSMQSIRK